MLCTNHSDQNVFCHDVYNCQTPGRSPAFTELHWIGGREVETQRFYVRACARSTEYVTAVLAVRVFIYGKTYVIWNPCNVKTRHLWNNFRVVPTTYYYTASDSGPVAHYVPPKCTYRQTISALSIVSFIHAPPLVSVRKNKLWLIMRNHVPAGGKCNSTKKKKKNSIVEINHRSIKQTLRKLINQKPITRSIWLPI